MNLTALRTADEARWERIVMRRPGLALPRLQALMHRREPVSARMALQGAFFVLERWGRAAELQRELQAALQQAEKQRALPEAAELSEAVGRLHYQRGDYAQACNAWSQTLDWARDDSRSACLARIGLAQLCYALGDWARGGRVLDQALLHYPDLGRDPYLRAKIALNRAVSLRATQGPQAAQPALDEALTAAREAGHRDYEAEATWHHARCARDSGDAALARTLALEALTLAQGCGYRWLQAQAAQLLSELQSGDVAVGWAGQALTLAETLQSRALQAAAHHRLAELMRERGELGPSWHQQQSQRLESILHRSPLPARLEALARFDTEPTSADALLLSLTSQAWSLVQPADFERAWQGLQPRLIEGLGLADLQLWWDSRGEGAYQRQPAAAGAPQLLARQMPGYVDQLSQSGEPLVCLSRHPWRKELGEAVGGPYARLEIGLRSEGRLVALLWLLRQPGNGWSRADISRAGRLAGLLERLLGALEPAPLGETVAELEALGAAARRIGELLNRATLSRDELAGLAQQIARGTEHIAHKLRRSAARPG